MASRTVLSFNLAVFFISSLLVVIIASIQSGYLHTQWLVEYLKDEAINVPSLRAVIEANSSSTHSQQSSIASLKQIHSASRAITDQIEAGMSDDSTRPLDHSGQYNTTGTMGNSGRPHKFGLPIIVVGLPKAGTTTVRDFFLRSGYNTSHYYCGKTGSPYWYCGKCMRNAYLNNRPLLASCGGFEVFAEMNFIGFNDSSACTFPQIEYLEEIHEEAPSATFILNTRNLSRWATSVTQWFGQANRLARCRVGPNSSSVKDLIDWHQKQINRIHDFVERHPSHKLIDIDIEDSATGDILAREFNSDPNFWGHSNANPDKNSEVQASQHFHSRWYNFLGMV